MCGEVRMRISAPPMITMACHCTGCQKLSASAFSLSVMVLGAAFEIVKGEPVVGALHGKNPYMFCPRCKNWLFTRLASAGLVNVRPAMFDIPEWSTPFIESMVREKLPWATTPAKHSFETFPSPEQYGPLMAEYAAQAGAG
ncbi:MAG: aldehyde-activating protein [Alphaproteobacteria bacterium]|nr:aldehyde-activating protein [Alphaproteobacteria bacterium]